MNKNTTIPKTEYLSAFLDDEAGAFEQRRMLDETQKDSELKKKIANYSLIGEAMRNEKSCVTVQANFLVGIHEKLEEEPTYQDVQIDVHSTIQSNNQSNVQNKKKAGSSKSWFNPVAGMAIAASLAAITVVTLNMNTDTTATSSAVVASSDTRSIPVMTVASGSASKATEEATVALSDPDKAWRKRLKKYVNSHVKYASTSAIMPSIRAASYVSSY